ncbi:MAG: helix-turn-helix transcriptional regulator [Clostridia bacterium]|nr:helix-turn-helix transcriptional regulator [Clostridia bacterium]
MDYSRRPHPKRTLESAVLLLGYSGECALAQDGREYILKKGTFQLLFPNTTHYGTAPVSENQSHFWCHFYFPEGFFIKEADDISEFEDSTLCVLPEFSQISDCEKYFILFAQMIDESEKKSQKNQFNNAISDSYIKILLCSLAQSAKEFSFQSNNNHILATKTEEWLRLHACEGATVNDASKSLKYNPNYLTQILKEKTGMTMCEYLNNIRLKEAKNLLLNSNKSVSEIAFSVGFSDEKYFMRLFRKKESITPTQYRSAHFRMHLNKK